MLILIRLTYETVLYYLQSKLIQEGVISGVAGQAENSICHAVKIPIKVFSDII